MSSSLQVIVVIIVNVVVVVVSTVKAQIQYDCPVDWVSHADRCYLFTFYPTLPYDEASQACHQDGASLVSVNTGEENTFIINTLAPYAGTSLNQWLTSGVERAGVRRWAGDGDSLTAHDAYWVIDPATESQVARNISQAQLVFQFSDKENRFGWAWERRTKSLPFICEISSQEVYRVYQRTRGFGYGSASTNPNTWLVGPRFVWESPSTVFVGHRTPVSIECTASGNPSPAYMWYRDFGKDTERLVLASERYTVTNGRLTISRPDEKEDAGHYTCVAENAAGRVFSNPILLSEGKIEEFSNDKPGERIATLYQGTVLDCSPPSYNPAVVIQWMKGNMFIRPEMNPHTFLSENGNLYFSEVQQTDAAEYHCVVTLVASRGEVLATQQSQSRVSRGIPLNIRGENANQFGPKIHDDFPAVFPTQPVRGREIRLECHAEGRLPLHYSWSRVDGGPMPMDRISNSSLNRVLHIREARIEDSGVYMCTVKGRVNVDTKSIRLQVLAVPYFKFPLRNQHLDVGSRLTWVCDAVSIPPATYTWYKNGHVLTSDPGVDIQVSGNVLTITSADSESHDGMYECLATNDLGTQTSIAQIRVLAFKPTFNKLPVEGSLMGSIGGNLTIHCRPEAAPVPQITWTHNGSPLGSSPRTQILASGDLLLSGLTEGDQGQYTCSAENSLGTAQSSGRLQVLQRTTLPQTPQTTTVSENSTAHLTCQASFPAHMTDLIYVWLFNGHPIDLSYDPAYRTGTFRGVHGLYIIGAQFKHEGWYECRATSVYDSVSARAYVTVMGSPGEPSGVHVKRVRGTEVTLWWQKGREHADPVTLYRVQYSSLFDRTWRSLDTDISAYNTQVAEDTNWRQYVITEHVLSPGAHYRFRVMASSANFGFGPPGASPHWVKMNDSAPIFAVDTVTGGGGSVGMLTVRWKPLPLEQHGGSGVYYRVHYRQHHNPDDRWQQSEPLREARTDREGLLTYRTYVHEVNYYKPYDVKVQVFNGVGPGPNSTQVIVMSAEDIPITTPQNVQTSGLNATAGLISWQLPNNTRETMRGKVLGYQINWWPWGPTGENCDGFQDREIIRFIRYYGTATEGVVIGLKANGDYWVNVQVFNSAGLSRPSGCNYLNTNYEAPLHYTQYVLVQSNGPESVRVSWRGISTLQYEYSVSGFKVWYWPVTENIRTAKVAVFPKQFTGVVHGIERDIIYKLRVLGTNAGGDGKKSPPTYFTLGGQVMLDPSTSEIMSGATSLSPPLWGLVTPAVLLLTYSCL